MYDAVRLFAKALDEVSRAQEIAVAPLSCNKAKPWEPRDRNSLLNYMKMVSSTYGICLRILSMLKHNFISEVV